MEAVPPQGHLLSFFLRIRPQKDSPAPAAEYLMFSRLPPIHGVPVVKKWKPMTVWNPEILNSKTTFGEDLNENFFGLVVQLALFTLAMYNEHI